MVARRAVLIALVLAGVFALGGRGFGQEFPTGPITFVVSFPPGGSIDVVMRAMAPGLQERLGKPVVIENRAGAGGNIAAAAVANAPPDGHTLLAPASSLAANPTLIKNMPFDTLKDLQAIALLFRTPLALVVCSVTLALCLLFFTGLLTNLPKAVLAAIVFAAVYRLVDIRALVRMWRVSRIDFYAAAIALVSVLLLGILQGVLLASIASIFLLLVRASHPNVAFLGRLPGSGRYSDTARHEGVEPLVGVIAFRPEASLLYINAETILEAVLSALQKSSEIKLVACDLSASPYIDLAGARMLRDLHEELASRHVTFCIVGAHGQLRDLLLAEGLAEKTDSGQWLRSLDSVLGDSRAK